MPTDEQPKLPEPSRNYQFMTVGFGILIGVLLLVFVVKEWVQTEKLADPSVDFSTYLNSHGLQASKASASKAVSLSAGSAFEVEVNGKSVWLCSFNTKNAEEAKALAALRDKPSLDVNGKPRPATVHGSLALVGYDGRSDEQEVLKAFEEFAKAPK